MKKKLIVIFSFVILVPMLLIAIFIATATPLIDHWIPRPEVLVDDRMRADAVDSLVEQMKRHYVFPEKARQIETLLRQRQKERKYAGITDGPTLAKLLKDDVNSIAQDKHLTVEFTRKRLGPDRKPGSPPATLEAWEKETSWPIRMFRHVSDLGLKKVDRLGPNIGYLQISELPPPFLVADKYAAAMDELADSDGLIIDLRGNGGGAPDTVALVLSYFVDGRTRLNDLWDRDTNVTTQQWTRDKLDGKRYGGKKPVVILVGPDTMSAGEDLAYTMQAMKRATVIGMPTWGGAHPTRFYRLGDHLYVIVPNRRVINPVTGSNWEGKGVIPDIAAAPDKALELGKAELQRQLDGGAPVAAGVRLQ